MTRLRDFLRWHSRHVPGGVTALFPNFETDIVSSDGTARIRCPCGLAWVSTLTKDDHWFMRGGTVVVVDDVP